MKPIELASDGLMLRAWRDGDADGVFRACQDPLIQRWTTVPVPYAREHAEHLVGQYTATAWAAEIAAPLGVFDARTGDLLGALGLVELDRSTRTGEIGTWVAPWARGRDVAERAGRAVAHWSFEVLRLRQLTWRVQVGNHASRLIAERIGFTFDGVSRALLKDRDGELTNGWRGVLLPGEVRDVAPPWVAPGGPGALRAATFGAPPERLPAGPVTLRQPAERDLDEMLATCRDPEAARWTTVPVPYLRVDAVAFLRDRVPGGWTCGTAAGFAIADPEDRFIGTIDLRIDLADPASAEVGYLVAPQARGMGYATAAVRAICAWGFTALGLTRVVWRAHLGNDASRRVAEKAGFVMEGVQRQGCEQRGERRDAWVAALLPSDR
jgi:RimJ/RimL family protein N-acetyltransferase